VAHYSAKLPEDTSRDSTRYALKRLSLRLTDPEKLSILRSEDVQRILHGRIGSRNDILIYVFQNPSAILLIMRKLTSDIRRMQS